MESTVGGLALACLTPRGGKSNHRFIIPTGSKLTETDLLRLAGLARKPDRTGEDYIRVGHTVEQFSGRDGDEWLVVSGPALKKLPGNDREKIRNFLATKMGLLGTLLANIDWDSFQERAAVESDELNQWQFEINQLPPNGDSGIRVKWLCGVLVMAAALLLAFFLIQEGFTLEGFFKKFIPWQKTPNLNSHVLLIAKSLGLPDESAVNPTTFTLSKTRSLFSIQETIEPAKSSKPLEKGLRTNSSDEEELLGILKKTFLVINGENSTVPKTIEDFSNNPGFLGNLERLFPKNNGYNIDPYGLVNEIPGVETLRTSIDPKKIGNFRTVCEGFAQLAKVDIKPDGHLAKNSDYREIYKALNEKKIKPISLYKGQAFFCPSDSDYAACLESIFDELWFKDLTRKDEKQNSPRDLNEKIKRLIKERDSGNPTSPFSVKGIKSCKESPEFSGDIKFLESLEKLLENLKPFGKNNT